MNTKNSSYAGCLRTATIGGRREGVCPHGHHRERDQLLGARWARLVRRAPKAKCHLSPPSPPAKRTGGEGEGLARLVSFASVVAPCHFPGRAGWQGGGV